MILRKVTTDPQERFHVYSCCNAEGESEMDILFESLDNSTEKQATKLVVTIQKAALLGPGRLPQDRSHKIRGDIWQFRADSLRVLYFYDEGSLVICTHAFVKKTRSTPSCEIDRAEKARQTYLEDKRIGRLKFLGEDEDEDEDE